MDDWDRQAFVRTGYRIIWLTGAIFMGVAGGLLTAMVGLPGVLGPFNSFNLTYVLTTSAMVAVTFGGLYSAAALIRIGTKP